MQENLYHLFIYFLQSSAQTDAEKATAIGTAEVNEPSLLNFLRRITPQGNNYYNMMTIFWVVSYIYLFSV